MIKHTIIVALIIHSCYAQKKNESMVANVNGINLHYKVAGKGEPLLLLHGWTQTSEFWKPYADRFAQHFKVYSLDLRGHGRTGILDRDFSIRQASEDVSEFIRQMGLSNAKAVGLSYGGLLLLEIAVNKPVMLESMVVIGVSDHFNGKERWKDQPPIALEDLDKDFQDHLRRQHPHGEKQVAALFNNELDYSISLSERQLQNIRSRVLVVNGDRDEIVGIDGAIRIFQSIPRASLWIVPSSGHIVPREEIKTEFLERIIAFLSER